MKYFKCLFCVFAVLLGSCRTNIICSRPYKNIFDNDQDLNIRTVTNHKDQLYFEVWLTNVSDKSVVAYYKSGLIDQRDISVCGDVLATGRDSFVVKYKVSKYAKSPQPKEKVFHFVIVDGRISEVREDPGRPVLDH